MITLLLAFALTATGNAPITAGAFAIPVSAKVSPTDPHAVQSLRLSLRLRDRAGLEALIAAQRDPSSPEFRRWLSPAEFGARFGVPEGDYQALVHLLEGAELKVQTFPSRLYLEAEGSAQAVAHLLGIHFVEIDTGVESYRSFRGRPSLPAALAPLVTVALGLDNRHRFRHRLTVGGATTMGPQDLRRYYDIDSLHLLGFGGQLSKVVAMGTVPSANNTVNPADIEYFYAAVSDASPQLVIDEMALGSSIPDGQPGLRTELEMDAEMSTVAAPLEQSVTLVLAPPDTLFTSAMNEVNNHFPDTTAVSVSFGTCELLEPQLGGLGEVTAVSDLAAQGASEGIAYFAATGDYGVLTCLPDAQNSGFTGADTPSVDFPASAPYITGVGGTMYTGAFNDAGAVGAYGSETTWNEPAIGAAGGGGVSTIYARPPWQVVSGVSDGGMREVPDLALLASVTPGVAIVSSRPGLIDPTGNGTSDAAPMAAGMFALVNDYLGGCRLGGVNPGFYALAAAQAAGGSAVFHDITTGDISIMGTTAVVTGPAAHAGYDEATGLGSLDVAVLAAAWPSCPQVVVDGGAPDAGELDAGAPPDAGPVVDAGPLADAGPAVDAGAAVDAGPVDAGARGFLWDGGIVGWQGAGGDAGARSAYVPCAVLACDIDAGGACLTTPQGPSYCQVPCSAADPSACTAGQFCSTAGICEFGCISDSQCQVDAGQVCEVCSNTCVRRGNVDAGVGDTCARRSDCMSGGTCIHAGQGFPGGYCTITCDFAACGCPAGSLCAGASPGQPGQCLTTCSVASQDCARNAGGYVCQPIDPTDVGVCFPQCTTDTFCQNTVGPGLVCDTTTHYCVSPSTSSSSSSSASTGTSASSSTSVILTSTSSSSAPTTVTSGGTSSGTTASSSASTSSSTHSTASSAAMSSSTVATSTSAHAASGSGSSAGGAKAKGGCGCNAPGGLDLSGLLGILLALRVRRRTTAS